MAWALALSGLLGGIASAIGANHAVSQQQAYNSAINRESFGYAKELNAQMLGINKELTSFNYGLERESRQTAFQDTKQDLESAGYNPLLALGSQSQGLNPGQTMSGNSFNGANSEAVINAISSAISGFNNTRQIDQLVRQTDSNIESSKSQNVVNYNLAELYHSQERGQNINNVIQDTYGLETAHENLENLKKDGLIKKSQQREIEQNIVESMSRSSYNSAQTSYIKQLTENSKQEFDINEPQRQFAKKHPIAHGTLQRINPVSALGSFAGLKYLFGGKPSGSMTINNYH